jgi:hypothetical protein
VALRLPPAAEVGQDRQELDQSGQFGPAAVRRFQWERSYSTAAYLELLRTYSGHRALVRAARAGLLDCIAGLIDSRHGGQITKCYLTELRVAHRQVR